MSFIDIFSYLVLWKKRNLQYQWCLIFFLYQNGKLSALCNFSFHSRVSDIESMGGKWMTNMMIWIEEMYVFSFPPHPIINLKRVQWMTVIASWRELMNVVTRMNKENMSFKISKNFISLNIFKSYVNLNKVQCQ